MTVECYFLILYAVMGVIAFCAYGIDKYRAKHDMWRIPEKTLLLLALLGGAIGAYLGMKTFHHKTQHKKFTIIVPLLALMQLAAVFWLLGFIADIQS